MGEGVRIHPVSHIQSTQTSMKAFVSEDIVAQPVRNTDRGSWVALGQEAVFPHGLWGPSRDGGLGPVHGGTRGSPPPFWVSLMEGLLQMVRNIFLPTPPFQMKTSKACRPLTNSPARALSLGLRHTLQRSWLTGRWSQHCQRATRSVDSVSRISLWRKNQRGR